MEQKLTFIDPSGVNDLENSLANTVDRPSFPTQKS
jgi:hypothetical protein